MTADLALIWPELILTIGGLITLMLGTFMGDRQVGIYQLSAMLTLAAAAAAVVALFGVETTVFSGTLSVDAFGGFAYGLGQRRFHMAELGIDVGHGGFDQPQGTNERARQAQAGNREILHGALSLRAIECRGRHPQFAHAVFLDAIVAHGISCAQKRNGDRSV